MIENKSSLHLDIAVKTSMGLGSCVVQFLALMKRGNSWFGVSIRGAINRIYTYLKFRKMPIEDFNPTLHPL